MSGPSGSPLVVGLLLSLPLGWLALGGRGGPRAQGLGGLLTAAAGVLGLVAGLTRPGEPLGASVEVLEGLRLGAVLDPLGAVLLVALGAVAAGQAQDGRVVERGSLAAVTGMILAPDLGQLALGWALSGWALSGWALSGRSLSGRSLSGGTPSRGALAWRRWLAGLGDVAPAWALGLAVGVGGSAAWFPDQEPTTPVRVMISALLCTTILLRTIEVMLEFRSIEVLCPSLLALLASPRLGFPPDVQGAVGAVLGLGGLLAALRWPRAAGAAGLGALLLAQAQAGTPGAALAALAAVGLWLTADPGLGRAGLAWGLGTLSATIPVSWAATHLWRLGGHPLGPLGAVLDGPAGALLAGGVLLAAWTRRERAP